MTDAASEWGGRTGAALRRVAGVVLSGLLAAVAWSVVWTYAFDHDWTGANSVRMIGLLRNHEPLDAAKRGFAVVCAVAILLAAVVALADHWLPWRLEFAAVGLALVVFLGWGTIFGPLTADRAWSVIDGRRFPAPSGLFGLDGGRATPIVGAFAAIALGFVMVRCQRVMADAVWWKPGRSLGTRGVAFDSLELPEEGAKEGNVGAAGDPDPLRRA